LDVLTARAGAAATKEAAVLPSTGPSATAKPPAKRRKVAAAVEAPRDGTLPVALGDTGVRILSDLGAAAGGVAGVPFGGGPRPGLDGTGVAPTPLVNYPFLLFI
jgi:hypothetical protein